MLVFLGVNDGNLEEGSFRCDANVSVRPGRPRTARHAHRDQEHQLVQVRRARPSTSRSAGEIAVVEAGGRVTQETRGWNPTSRGKTFSQRRRKRRTTTATYRTCRPSCPGRRIEALRQAAPAPEQLRAEWTRVGPHAL
ncbi:MAG: hypothetical protein IPH72_30820 [Sandaracinaceae bacterium]|nr:hypothetical protein [Sandaracinaceae bacterium]